MSAQLDLLDKPVRRVADTSLEAWRGINENLTQREIAVYKAVWGYLRATLHEDVTGAELADYMRWPATSTRPRLTGLLDKGWLIKGQTRSSRIHWEKRCHGYRPALPLSAVRESREG